MTVPALAVIPLAASQLGELLELYRHLHRVDEPLSKDAVRAVWKEICSNPRYRYFGAHAGGKLISTCALTVIPNLTRGARPYGVIENVVTHPDFRRLGAGRSVLQVALAHAWKQGCYKVMLATGRSDAEALAFYLSAGFRANEKRALVARPPTEAHDLNADPGG